MHNNLCILHILVSGEIHHYKIRVELICVKCYSFLEIHYSYTWCMA